MYRQVHLEVDLKIIQMWGPFCTFSQCPEPFLCHGQKTKDCSRLLTIRSLPFCFYYLWALISLILHLSLILTWTPQHKFPNQIDLQNINFNSHPLPKQRKNAVHAEPPWQLWPSSVRFGDNPSSSSHPRVCTLLWTFTWLLSWLCDLGFHFFFIGWLLILGWRIMIGGGRRWRGRDRKP